MRVLKVIVPNKLVVEAGEYDLDRLEVCGREDGWLRRRRDGRWWSYPYVEGDRLAMEAVRYLKNVASQVAPHAEPEVIEVTDDYGFVQTSAPEARDFASAITVARMPNSKRVVAVLRRLVERQLGRYRERGHDAHRVQPGLPLMDAGTTSGPVD